MSASIARIGDAFRLNPKAAGLVALIVLAGVTGLVAIATWQGLLPMAFGLVFLAIVVAASFRWPLMALAGFAALIPIEEVLLIGGIGTISRFAGILFVVTYGLPRIGRIAFGAMPPAGWALLAWSIVSLGWAMDPDVALAQLPTLVQLFIIAVLVADFIVEQPAMVRPLLWVYSAAAAATALAGILSYAATDARAAALQDQSPAQFAAVLLPALAFGLYEVLKGDRRVLGGAVFLLTTLGVLVSGTRGAWVAAAVVALLFILPQLKPRRRLAAIALAAATALLVAQVPGVTDLVSGRIETALSSGGAGRTDIWSVGATIYQSAPVLGVGYANFPVAYTPEVVLTSNVARYALTGAGPHNLVLGTLVELGPIGLLLLALFLVPLVLQRGWGPNAATVRAALASLVTMALFLDIVGNRKQVWLFIGFAAGLGYLARRRRIEQSGDAGLGNTVTEGGGPPGADAGVGRPAHPRVPVRRG